MYKMTKLNEAMIWAGENKKPVDWNQHEFTDMTVNSAVCAGIIEYLSDVP